MGHNHMLRIKMHMAEDSRVDRKCCQETGCNKVVDGTVMYCKIHSWPLSRQIISTLQGKDKNYSDLFGGPIKGNQFNENVSSIVACTEHESHVKYGRENVSGSATCTEQESHDMVKYDGDDRFKLKDSSGNTQGETALCPVILKTERKCCQEPGCNEVVDGTVMYCKIHSGGLSRQHLTHVQSAHENSGFLVAPIKGNQFNGNVSSTVACTEQESHVKYKGDDRFKLNDNSGNAQGATAQYVFRGVGMPCKHENCSKQAQENTIYCKLHSGVIKGCMVRGCPRGAHGGTPLCIGHGGGKRCVIPGCPNAACGRGDRCVRHGGGKRCKFEGCAKGAQGSTDYCIRHGGGRRCKYEGCTKSAQGRTDFCIRHGGGSRCKYQGCGTSAKWRTDFCSVHMKSSLNGESSIPEPLPASSEKKRRAKKPKKATQQSGVSQENVTMAAAAGSSAQVVAPLSMKSPTPSGSVVTTAAAAGSSTQLVSPLSMKSPTPSGSVVSTETEAGASRPVLGL